MSEVTKNQPQFSWMTNLVDELDRLDQASATKAPGRAALPRPAPATSPPAQRHFHSAPAHVPATPAMTVSEPVAEPAVAAPPVAAPQVRPSVDGDMTHAPDDSFPDFIRRSPTPSVGELSTTLRSQEAPHRDATTDDFDEIVLGMSSDEYASMSRGLATEARRLAHRAHTRYRATAVGVGVGGAALATWAAIAVQIMPGEIKAKLYPRTDQIATLTVASANRQFVALPDQQVQPRVFDTRVLATLPAPLDTARGLKAEPTLNTAPLNEGATDMAPRFALDLVLTLDKNDQTLLPIRLVNASSVPPNAYVMLRGLPEGASLNHGEEVRSGGTWGLTLNHLDGLKLTVPPGTAGEFDVRLDLLTSTGAVLTRASSTIRVERQTLITASNHEVDELISASAVTEPVTSPLPALAAPPARRPSDKILQTLVPLKAIAKTAKAAPAKVAPDDQPSPTASAPHRVAKVEPKEVAPAVKKLKIEAQKEAAKPDPDKTQITKTTGARLGGPKADTAPTPAAARAVRTETIGASAAAGEAHSGQPAWARTLLSEDRGG